MTVTNFPNGIAADVTGNVVGNVTGNTTGSVVGAVQETATAALIDGAIAVKEGTVWITKGTAAALTLAAPTATTDDGKTLKIVSTTAAAHTVTQATPGFNNGGAASDVATFGAAIGNSIELQAYQGVWYTVGTPRGVTLA